MTIITKPPHVVFGSRTIQVPQYGHFGWSIPGDARRVSMDLNTTTTAMMIGRQGAGKSYTLGTFIEMYTHAIAGINVLPKPGCALVFHYSQSPDYRPEWWKMNLPNTKSDELDTLKSVYGAMGTGVPEIIEVTPPDLVEFRKAELASFGLGNIPVYPLTLHPSEVYVDSYQHLMGANDVTTIEMQELLNIMKSLRFELSPDKLCDRVDKHPHLSKEMKWSLLLRINKAAEYISPQQKLIDLFKPGRVIIVDIRDEFMHSTDAFKLMLSVLNVYQRAVDDQGQRFPKLCVFDEMHEYSEDTYLMKAMVRMIRLMRHKKLTILLASQDPMSLPKIGLDLASMVVALGMESEEWVEYLCRSKGQMRGIAPSLFTELTPGEAYVFSREASDVQYTRKPHKIRLRPRASLHGGATQVAVA